MGKDEQKLGHESTTILNDAGDEEVEMSSLAPLPFDRQKTKSAEEEPTLRDFLKNHLGGQMEGGSLIPYRRLGKGQGYAKDF